MTRLVRPRYWVRSHDTVLGNSGVVMRLIRVAPMERIMDDGLEEEARARG